MKKQIYTTLALVVLIGSMVVATQAQSNGRTSMMANIPFQFSVGDKVLPAGEYTVVQINPASDRAVLRLRNRDGSASALVQMNLTIAKATENAKLVFNCYGNRYFFAQAWIDGDRDGLQASKPRAERAIKRELAGIKPRAQSVALTAAR